MTTKDEALRLALEALTALHGAKLVDGTYADKDCKITFAITAIREAMAQPAGEQQEPFGYVSEHNCQGPFEFQFHKDIGAIYTDNCRAIHKVYTDPQPAALLSADAQPSSPVALQWLAEMIMSDCGCSTTNQRLLERVMDRIEKYERANTTAQPVGERGGYALAMAVLQSDLYHKLDDVERAECDALLSSDAQPSEWEPAGAHLRRLRLRGRC